MKFPGQGQDRHRQTDATERITTVGNETSGLRNINSV